MGTVEIIVIVLVSAFVLAMVVAMVVRKLKGKPSLGSDCGCCPYSGKCNCSCHGEEDISDIVAAAKEAQGETSQSRSGGQEASAQEDGKEE